jgi:hypothetical protein
MLLGILKLRGRTMDVVYGIIQCIMDDARPQGCGWHLLLPTHALVKITTKPPSFYAS